VNCAAQWRARCGWSFQFRRWRSSPGTTKRRPAGSAVRGSGRGAEEEIGERISEAASVVASVAGHQADALAALVRQYPPPVDPLLVDPAAAVERFADERGGHRRVLGNHALSFYVASLARDVKGQGS
jgi:hypothetical protein